MARRTPGPLVVAGELIDTATPEGRAKLAEIKTAVIRMRNFGAALDTIADKLGLRDSAVAEDLLSEGLRELVADDAEAIRARQQATLNDIRRAMYPAMAKGDKDSAGVILSVLKHEADIHPGVKAPQRVRVGLDADEFVTRVDEDIRALGIHPRMDVGLEEHPDDDDWATT
jgi:hypothetical protein